MNNRSSSQSGFGVVEALLILVILGIIGFTGWRVYEANREVSNIPADNSTITKSKTSTIPSSWLDFNETSVGLSFKYPDSWGKAKFEVMNPQPDALNKTFYKIAFEKNQRIITVKPKDTIQSFDTTLAGLKDSIATSANSRYVFVNKSDFAAIIVPSNGNQDSELYAAKSVSLPKINADTLVLLDAVTYGSADSCKADAYADCYPDKDKEEIKLFLQELKAN